ncbi:MAG: glycosyltransferase family 8 protein [Cyanobacteria bacterium SIG28]|nr:glycosyltransferase family 8 protein [Cyanobacteria bacterium SIG28]
MHNIINVCLACDDNYAKYAGVVIASALANAKVDDILHFYILDGGIKESHKNEIRSLKSIKDCEINFIEIDENQFEEYKIIKTHSYISLPAYYRLKIASILPEIDRIIYFDCDVIVNSSLAELYNTDFEDNLIAGALDINKIMLKKNPKYVNSGVLVLNLEKFRLNNIESKFLEWTKENINNIKLGDQEIINEVCRGKIKIVADEWNVQSSNFTNRSSYTNNPKVIHFVAHKKPWHWASFSFHRDLYFKNLQFTPWALNEEELKHWTKDNQIASLIEYFKYRPFFLLRPRFYQALFYTYIKPMLGETKL